MHIVRSASQLPPDLQGRDRVSAKCLLGTLLDLHGSRHRGLGCLCKLPVYGTSAPAGAAYVKCLPAAMTEVL